MKIQEKEQDRESSPIPAVGDIVRFVSNKGNNIFLVTDLTSLGIQADCKYALVDLETGDAYFRKFTSLVHIKNHLNRHYNGFRIITERATLVID